MAGGWEAAALLPLSEGLNWVQDHLRSQKWEAYRHACLVWASTLPAYATGGTPPDPPDPPEED